MIEKRLIRLIRSLERRKERVATGLFVAEGHKLVGELLATFQPKVVVATPTWIEHTPLPSEVQVHCVTPEELARASLQQHPQDVIALFGIPYYNTRVREAAEQGLVLALDGVQDPGNLGTIVRLADWFGIRHVFCASGTADVWAPKAVQSTMGALARVQVHYVDLAAELADTTAPIYGTFLGGECIYTAPLSPGGVIVMGNEGQGISPAVSALVGHRLTIPPYPAGCAAVESLNVAVATAIVCSEFRRRVSFGVDE